MKRILSIQWLAMLLALISMAACSSDDDNTLGTGNLVVDEAARTVTIDNQTLEASVGFLSRVVWSATVTEGGEWLTAKPAEGVGGNETLRLFASGSNNSKEARTAIVTVSAGIESVDIYVTQPSSDIVILSESDIQDFAKYYKPQEFSSMNMLRSDAKWSWVRSRQSEHFVVFWEAGFGDDPNAESVPAELRVDIDDLLLKAERFFDTNVNKLKMADLASGTSNLNKYKMEIYLLYQTEWLATGSGYDDVIGALWVNPSTCQPVGSTIAHEIGHSFQYQTYCDKIANGATDDKHHGFRYGYPGSNGGCAYWEMCAQWQAHQDYPEEQFTDYHVGTWAANCHRHFEHEWMRYQSYWLQTMWVNRHGVEAYGRIWRESEYPEDPIATYTRIYNSGNWQQTREELADYALRMATYDIDGVREYNTNNDQHRYKTALLKNSRGYYQPTYAYCPGSTGFNVIPLDVPVAGTKVSVSFNGLTVGSPLVSGDPGEVHGIVGDNETAVTGTTTTYNTVGTNDNMGWRYGFVALSTAGQRTYSTIGRDKSGTLDFTVPAGTLELYLVVQGSPETYVNNAWDNDELTDAQYPYEIKVSGTDMTGYFDIDEAAEPQSIVVRKTLECNSTDYVQGTLSILSREVCQAFALSSDVLATKISAVGTTPAEGIIVLANTQTDGSLVYDGKANNGFWLDMDCNNGVWGDDAGCYYELAGTTLTYGAYPGHIAKGTDKVIRPTLVYTKGGQRYSVTFELTLKF